MKCAEFINLLEQQAAESYACAWDNVGLLVGSREKEIKKAYLALDATDEAITQAVAAGADLLLTHHPLIFQGMKRITEEDFIGRRVIALIRADMAYYVMHTNFDVMGMARLAADKLGFSDDVPLEVTCVEDGVAHGIGRVGNLAHPMTLAQCCAHVKQVFGLEHVKVFGDLTRTVRYAAVCPGAGKSDVQHALDAGAQVYITGDIDHHTGIDAAACGMAVIDAGHYGIEHIFIPYMEQFLRSHAPNVEVVAQGRIEPFRMI